MAELYSQYTSGVQFTAGTISGSASGVSGLNPIVDRLNSTSSNLMSLTGSLTGSFATVLIGSKFIEANTMKSQDTIVFEAHWLGGSGGDPNLLFGISGTVVGMNRTIQGTYFVGSQYNQVLNTSIVTQLPGDSTGSVLFGVSQRNWRNFAQSEVIDPDQIVDEGTVDWITKEMVLTLLGRQDNAGAAETFYKLNVRRE